jgi:nucleotide-binding universal stress UspA family protein
VPVDFSSQSEAALLLGCRLAGCFDVDILVLHVVHDPGEMPGYYAKTLKKKHLHRIEEGAAQMLQDFLAEVAKEHPHEKAIEKAESLLVKGLPTTRILEVAEKRNATLIVMGSTGRTGIKHLLLGSVAERVVQLSPVPVTVAKSAKR